MTSAWGLDFRHGVGPEGSYFMPEIMVPGCALFDADGDGDLDAYVVNAGPSGRGAPNRFYRQDPGPHFVEATAASGLGDPGYGVGVAVGDVDNDGDLDVYLTNVGPNAFYRNRGDATFEDVSGKSGTRGGATWSASAVFFDADLDGDLDLYVANYLALDPEVRCPDAAGRPDYCGPRVFPGVSDAFYRNNGDGTFVDATRESGIAAIARRGLGVVAADFNEDGRPDIYVANDNEPNCLWIARDDGTFRDEALVRGVALNQAGREEASMGVVCEDLDGDLDLDLFLTHLRGESNTFYRNLGQGMFEDATDTSGLLAPSLRFTGFGAVAVDLEQDGDLDLLTLNGHVFRGPEEPGAAVVGPFWKDYAQPGQLFLYSGDRFEERSSLTGIFGEVPRVGRGLALGDLDDDGSPDLLGATGGGPAVIYANRAPGRGHWLLVEAYDPLLRRDAAGALVTLEIGNRRLRRRADPASSYASSSDPRAHFGLGGAERYDGAEVCWPGGARERFPGGMADRVVVLRRGEGAPGTSGR